MMTEISQNNLEKSESEIHPNILAFIISIIGGVLMIISGGMFTMMLIYGSSYLGMMNYGGMMGGMMGGQVGMMGSLGMPIGYMTGLGLIGLVAGLLVIISSIMMYIRPSDQRSWGVVIIIFSIISYAGMGGFWIGGILGLIGGILTLSNPYITRS